MRLYRFISDWNGVSPIFIYLMSRNNFEITYWQDNGSKEYIVLMSALVCGKFKMVQLTKSMQKFFVSVSKLKFSTLPKKIRVGCSTADVVNEIISISFLLFKCIIISILLQGKFSVNVESLFQPNIMKKYFWKQ